MKGARISDYNAAPVVEEVEKPEIGPNEVLVRVHAASLNPLDVKLQRGFMKAFFPLAFPYSLGTDFSGVVEHMGVNATQWREGDKIIGRLDPTKGGALAEYVVISADDLASAPKTVSLVSAAGLPTTAGTAWQALFELTKLKAGQSILIHAGAGGVGSFAIQFARFSGARVVAAASGDGLDIAQRLGADQVIDYRSEDFAEKLSDIDVVFDTIGGETQQRSFQVLRAGGLLIASASPPDEALAKAHRVEAKFVFHSSGGERLRKIVEMLDMQGQTVLVDRTVALSHIGSAFEHQASGRAHGKIIVTIN